MKIIVADHSGFCSGVQRVNRLLTKQLEDGPVYSLGDVIHNSQYIEEMEKRGLIPVTEEEMERREKDYPLVIRAHGMPEEDKKKWEEKGVTLLDATCPVLLSIYKKLKSAKERDEEIVIVGDANHPEVIAMNSVVDYEATIINSVEEAKEHPLTGPTFVLSQTTNRKEHFEEVAKALPGFEKYGILQNTICNATSNRQKATAELAKKVDCMVVIGGKKSSNTEKLSQVAKKYCQNVYKVEVFEDLPLQNLREFNTIGITAGASTPDWIIEEVVRGMDNLTNEEFMEQVEDSMIKIYPRDIVKGKVLNVKDNEVFVDIKFRADGIIKLDEMTEEQRENPQEAFHEGEEIDVYVIKLDDGEGNVALSTRRVEGLKNWKKLVEKYENEETVEANVTGDNSGGLTVNVMGINGFIPASQITTYYVKNFKQFVGKTLECKIISIDEKKRRVVLSSRAVKEQQLDEVWEKIEVGKKVTGKVVRMTDFGAFVDLGGVDALVHVSDISWTRIDKPSDVLEIGQEIEGVILKANRDRNRISVGMKQLTEKPFDVFVNNNKVGDVVTGKVVNMLDFGAFVRLKEGVEGLIHVSQISNQHVEKPSDELNLGDEVTVKILDIDVERQRIALSIRALEEPAQREQRPQRERRPRRQSQNREYRNDNSFEENDFGNNLGDLIQLNLDAQDE